MDKRAGTTLAKKTNEGRYVDKAYEHEGEKGSTLTCDWRVAVAGAAKHRTQFSMVLGPLSQSSKGREAGECCMTMTTQDLNLCLCLEGE
ncbi:unnamed protein product [Amoebophrya sp. A25]|nr:unnamed protein product [Amoebophrya sp. A25]|eukprot:GSA25T00004126001.1